ncbi:unnamed protein product, partial [marine sediment metagenome]
MLTGIFGALGSGKTLLLVYLAYIQKYTYHNIIISNFQLSFADIVESAEEMILKMDDYAKKYKQKICYFIDELGGILKATNFMQSSNEIMTDIALKSRKRKVDINYTAQHHMMVDRMIRRITDVAFYPSFNLKEQTISISPREFNGEYWVKGEPFSFEPPEYYKYYDTGEVILPNKEAIVAWYIKKIPAKEKMLIQLANESK